MLVDRFLAVYPGQLFWRLKIYRLLNCFFLNLLTTMSNADSSYPKNRPSKDYLTRDLGRQLWILQLNVEGIGMEKSSYTITRTKNLCSHAPGNPCEKSRITGFTLVSVLFHRRCGSTTYVRNGIYKWNHLYCTAVDSIFDIAIYIYSRCKPT